MYCPPSLPLMQMTDSGHTASLFENASFMQTVRSMFGGSIMDGGSVMGGSVMGTSMMGGSFMGGSGMDGLVPPTGSSTSRSSTRESDIPDGNVFCAILSIKSFN